MYTDSGCGESKQRQELCPGKHCRLRFLAARHRHLHWFIQSTSGEGARDRGCWEEEGVVGRQVLGMCRFTAGLFSLVVGGTEPYTSEECKEGKNEQ